MSAARPSPAVPGVPSQDGLRLILAGVGYLLLICALQLVLTVSNLAGGARLLPANALEVRDVVALFGWVGFMISGVSVIIVPNHLRVRIRPAYLPKVHLGLANVGLVGFFLTSLFLPASVPSEGFLAIVSASFLAFGLGVLGTVLPFLRFGRPRPVEPPLARPSLSERQRPDL